MAIRTISENVLSHDTVAKKRHNNIKESLLRVEHDVTDHHREWGSKVKKGEKSKKSLTITMNSRNCKVCYEILTSRSDEILRWLSSTDPSINQNAARGSHEPQTGKWFICGREYSHWKETPQSFLWIHGIAGCGKTVMS